MTAERNEGEGASGISRRAMIQTGTTIAAAGAVFIVPNVEHWDVKDDKGHMDVRNEPRNDYGLRVAIWRLFEIFQARNIRTTIALNASVCRFYPDIIAAFKQ